MDVERGAEIATRELRVEVGIGEPALRPVLEDDHVRAWPDTGSPIES